MEILGQTPIEPQEKNAWDNPQKRFEVKQYHITSKLDDEEMQTLHDWLNGPMVEVYRDLNDETDYAVHYLDLDGKTCVARVSDTVNINGVQWNLVPGKNLLPVPIYEFLIQNAEQARMMSRPQPGVAQNLMGNQLFKSSRSDD